MEETKVKAANQAPLVPKNQNISQVRNLGLNLTKGRTLNPNFANRCVDALSKISIKGLVFVFGTIFLSNNVNEAKTELANHTF